ncbi:MAG TPA: PEGA domain-containing protein [Caldisericia bacterium]|nr:PEGA domain-containing protein [Caldisericia bacterium]
MVRKVLTILLIAGLIGVFGGCFLEKTSIVKINSELEEVEVFIRNLSKDKKSEWIDLGKTPIETKFEKGEYEIRVEKDNYLIQRKNIKISKNKEYFEFKLEKVPIIKNSVSGYVINDKMILGNRAFNIFNREKSLWEFSENDIDKTIYDFYYSGISQNEKIDILSLYSWIKDPRPCTGEIIFLNTESGEFIGYLIISPIFWSECAIQPENRIIKTEIEFSFNKSIKWERDIDGYYEFVKLLDKKLYFTILPTTNEQLLNNRGIGILIMNYGNGEIEKKIYFKELGLKENNIGDIVIKKEKIFITSYNGTEKELIVIDIKSKTILKRCNFKDYSVYHGDEVYVDSEIKIPEDIKDLEIPENYIVLYYFEYDNFLYLIIYKNDVPAKSEPKLLCFNKRDGNLIFKYDIIFPSIIFGYKDDKIIFEYRYLIGLNEYYFDNGFAYKIELDKLINDIK